MFLPLHALLGFGVLITSAAVAYPGGTWRDPARPGFSFWHNFWCDLLSSPAINGEPNWLGAILARLAFALFAYALFRFWPLAAQRAGVTGAGESTGARLGRFGAFALLAVALVPSATSEIAHGVAVVVSASASLVALGTLLPGLFRRGERSAAMLGVSTLLVALVCLIQYVYQGAFAASGDPGWLAGMQKVTTALLLAFMVRLLIREPSTVQPEPRGHA